LSGQVHTNQTIEHYKLTLSLRDNFSVRLQRSSLGNSKLKYCLHYGQRFLFNVFKRSFIVATFFTFLTFFYFSWNVFLHL